MNSEQLLTAMVDIDEYLIADATASVRKKSKQHVALRWTALAASLLLVLGYTAIGRKRTSQEELPILTISEEDISSFGFEGYMAYDIGDLINANPWREEMKISTLPVYQNMTAQENNTVPIDEMEAVLTETAIRLQLNIDKLTANSHTEDDGVQTTLVAQADDIHIAVDTSLSVVISFTPSVILPDTYHFSHYSSYEEMTAVAGYLKDEYRLLMGFTEPQINIFDGDYNIYGQQGYHIEIFNGADTVDEQILNYNFNRVGFYCDDDGRLSHIRLFHYDRSQKMGDYPLVTAEQAENALWKGRYITTVPYDWTGKETVAKVELIYRTGRNEDYYLPYYRFYVELPEAKKENGLNVYGTYYVPAIPEQYLDVTVWDGSFNG